LDDFIKSELHRLSSRLDATDVRIQRLISGEAPANPKQFVDAGRIQRPSKGPGGIMLKDHER
jgi:hypothetical protein